MSTRTTRRRLVAAVAAVGAAATLVGGALRAAPAEGARTTTTDQWRVEALSALGSARIAADAGGATTMVWANLTRASANLTGWDSPTTRDLLARTLAGRHRDGGYGLPRPSDVFGDGTVNPATTGYVITAADHVGPMLLEAYAHGAVPRAQVESVRDWLMRVPRATTRKGACLPYTNSPHDAVVARPDGTISRCVYNVNGAAAAFLTGAARAGITRPGQTELARRLTAYTNAALTPSGRWPYMSGRATVQDLDHNSANVEAQWVLAPRSSLTARVVAAELTAPLTADPTDHLGRLRSVVADPRRCEAVQPSARALRVELSHRSGTGALTPTMAAIRYSQAAVWESRAALHCPSRPLT